VTGTLATRAPLVSTRGRPVLAVDDPAGVPGTVAQAGVDPTLDGHALQLGNLEVPGLSSWTPSSYDAMLRSL
jgi:hypothetical protein